MAISINRALLFSSKAIAKESMLRLVALYAAVLLVLALVKPFFGSILGTFGSAVIFPLLFAASMLAFTYRFFLVAWEQRSGYIPIPLKGFAGYVESVVRFAFVSLLSWYRKRFMLALIAIAVVVMAFSLLSTALLKLGLLHTYTLIFLTLMTLYSLVAAYSFFRNIFFAFNYLRGDSPSDSTRNSWLIYEGRVPGLILPVAGSMLAIFLAVCLSSLFGKVAFSIALSIATPLAILMLADMLWQIEREDSRALGLGRKKKTKKKRKRKKKR